MNNRLSFLFGMMTSSVTSCFATNTMKPNIILFLVDDMGWQETSVPFYRYPTLLNHRYHTPNMERLAAKAFDSLKLMLVRFHRHHVARYSLV